MNTQTTDKSEYMQKMSELLDADHVYAHVYQDGCRTEYVVRLDPEELANFIGSHPTAWKIEMVNFLDMPVMSTIGFFIDRCYRDELLEPVKKFLLPIQQGQADAKPVFAPTVDEVDKYFEEAGVDDNIWGEDNPGGLAAPDTSGIEATPELHISASAQVPQKPKGKGLER